MGERERRFSSRSVVLLGILLVWKGGRRGVLCLLMLAAVLAVTDGFVCNTIKHAVGRERPFLALPDVHCLIGKGKSGSMPSSHAANWFAATMVLLIYYRRSVWVMLPAAILVSFSRVYNGVHYPSDVLAGALLGAGCAGAILWLLDGFWLWAGRKWFPLWWEKMPSLLALRNQAEPEKGEEEPPLEPTFAANTRPCARRVPCSACDAGCALGAAGLSLHRRFAAGTAGVYRQRDHPTGRR